MSRTRIARLVGQCVAGALLAGSTSPAARADEAGDLCLADSIEGQVLKAHGRYARAREHLEQCAAPVCDEALRTRCAASRDEVIAKTPVLLIHPRDDRGEPLADATVRLDGAVIDAAGPVPLDLGAHALRVEHAGRRFELAITDPKPGVQEIAATIDLRSHVPTRPTPTVFWLLGGTSAAGLVAFGALAGVTLQKQQELQSCTPYCNASSQGPLQATEIAADVALGVGVAAALAATFVYIARPTRMKEVRISAQGATWAF